MQSLKFNLILESLKEILFDITKIEVAEIDENKNLIEMGLDSITFSRIKKSINSKFGVEIKFSMLYSKLSTLRLIGEYIEERTSDEFIKNLESIIEPKKITEESNMTSEEEIELIMNNYSDFKLSEIKDKLDLEFLNKDISDNDIVKLFVLDDDMQICSFDVEGSIYVGEDELDIYKTNSSGKILKSGKLLIAGAEKETVNIYNSNVNITIKENYYETSAVQKRMYALHKLNPSSLNYNLVASMLIEGNLDIHRLENVLNEIISENEVLRTYFEEVDGELVQKIEEEFIVKINCIEKLLNIDEEEFIKEQLEDFVKPFNLNTLPLINFKLLKINDERHILLLNLHHIIFDGASLEIFMKELLKLYNGVELHNKDIQYRDYCVWKNQFDNSNEIKLQESYWKELFCDQIPVLEMPTDFKRPLTQTFDGNNICLNLGNDLSKDINEFCKNNDVTPYVFFMASINLLLHKYSGQDDIVVGTVVEGRNKSDLDNVMGMFVNTIPVRNTFSTEDTFKQFMDKVKKNFLEAVDNSDYEFERLVNLFNDSRDLSRNPLFDVMIIFQNHKIEELKMGELKISSKEIKNNTSKVDLSFEIRNIMETYECNIEFNTNIFKADTIERLKLHLEILLKNILKQFDKVISKIGMLSSKEENKLLFEFNNEKVDFPEERTIQGLFEEQVERTPDNIAVVYEDKKLTYRELNRKANKLARILRKKGVKPNSIVGIMTERSLEMIISILGILKASGSYLPIDIKLPEERIKYMIGDSKISLLVTTKEVSRAFKLDENIEKVDLHDKTLKYESDENLNIINKTSDLAYIIYTSGTTGKPKGVMIEHNNVVRLLFNSKMPFDFNHNDIWTMFHSYCFDFSVWEMYGALLYGGKLIIVPEMVTKDSERYLELLKNEKVTVLNQTPTAFNNLISIEMSKPNKELSLRYIIFGGEALQPKKLAGWKEKYKETKIINMYGITETTVHVTFKEIEKKEIDNGISNIGKHIPTLTTYVMDKNLNLQPIGVPGELCVGGKGVARGYLNRSELTQKRFVENPYKPDERIYRSGDLVKMLSNGEMEYLGRIDKQVKVRGFRIELGEIENRLLSYGDVKEAVVMAKVDSDNEVYICSYLVCNKNLSRTELKKYLKETLPDYMIPSYFIYIDKVPITNNGKVNYKMLPEPSEEGLIIEKYEAPTNEIEEKVSRIWSEVLGIDKIGINNNFFDIGGHSLKGTVVINKIYKELNVQIPLKELFSKPTIREISEYIKNSEKDNFEEIKKCTKQEYYEATSAQKRMYSLQQLEKDSKAYNMSLVFESNKAIDEKRLEYAINQVISRHDALRSYFEVINGDIVQKILDRYSFKLDVVENRDVEEQVEKFIKAFDLAKAPLFRVLLIHNDKNDYLLIDMHHIISDGVSINIFIKEVSMIYNGIEVDELKLQYKDFAMWQNKLLTSQKIKKEEAYWLDVFKDDIPILNLQYDYERPLVQSFEGDIVSFTINEETTNKLRMFAKSTKVTMNMMIMSIFYVLLAKHTGQEDILLGVPVAGRTQIDLQNIMGMFVNTIVLRNKPNSTKKFKEFLSEVKVNSIKSYENQNYQFEDLVRKLKIKRKPGRNPVFDVMFSMSNSDYIDEFTLDDVKLKQYVINNKISKLDLTLDVVETDKDLKMSFEYSTKLFKKETIERAIKDIKAIIDEVLNDEEILIGDICIRSKEEESYMIQEEQNIQDIKDQDFNF